MGKLAGSGISILWLLMSLSIHAWATEMTLILDTGKTVPVPGKMMPVNLARFQARSQQQPVVDPPVRADYAGLFPLHTPQLVLGAVVPRAQDLPSVLKPLYIVGCDKTSLQGLKSREQYLLGAQAVGFVIECRSLNLFRRMRALFPRLVLTPVHGQQMVNVYGLSHYPVVITPQGITQ